MIKACRFVLLTASIAFTSSCGGPSAPSAVPPPTSSNAITFVSSAPGS